ncbi:hypothetical protein F4778DRAFT_782613 [Xylariomycetidae sp. FL2044]|nr:hypothetical protein F4778DRAFT_782613 [Xylariomycetidae sp. FL2044]
MASSPLPQDIVLLICQELAAQQDFDTLYHCALASRRVASIALVELYSIHEYSPAYTGDNKAQQPRLWRSLILSSIGKTLLAYCAYVRHLSLGNLEELLEDIRWDKSARSFFFGGDMQDFIVIRDNAPAKNTRKAPLPAIDLKPTMIKCAESITKFIKEIADKTETAVALQHLEGYYIPHDVLPTWISRLGTLQSLRIRDGSVLGVEAASAIAEYCPNFSDLTVYWYQSGTADEDMAAFFQTLPPNTLRNFRVISRNQIGEASLAALNAHSKSLRALDLSSLSKPAMEALNALPNCTELESLNIENYHYERADLSEFKNGVLKEVAAWISHCKNLRDLSFKHVQDALFILKEVLSSPDIHLTSLSLLDFQSGTEEESRSLWTALGKQDRLESLTLGLQDGTIDSLTLSQYPPLTDSICNLKNLTSLNLMQASVTPEEIRRFAKELPDLVEFSFSGEFVDDDIWEPLSSLTKLKLLSINAPSVFSLGETKHFAMKLDRSSNYGIRVDILNQMGEAKFPESQMKWLEDYFIDSLNGRVSISYPNDPAELHMSDFSDTE